jgi:hypothetical protein
VERWRRHSGLTAPAPWRAKEAFGDTATKGSHLRKQGDGTSGGQLLSCDRVPICVVAAQRVRGLDMFGGVAAAALEDGWHYSPGAEAFSLGPGSGGTEDV